MLRDDRADGGGRRRPPRNVLGQPLDICSIKPMTGFYRDGCCNTGREDIGSHTICAVMTSAFLDFSKSRGNDLSTPVPEFGFSTRSIRSAKGMPRCALAGSPPKDKARRGMQYAVRFALKRDGEMVAPPRMTYSSHNAPSAVRDVYRDAVDAALKRCTPLHFTEGMGGAVAGRPVAIRFVDDRTINNQ